MHALVANSWSNPRTRRLLVLSAVALFVLVFLYSASDTSYANHVKSQLPSSWSTSSSPSSPSATSKKSPIKLDPDCSTLPGADEVLLVMKTGSSVVEKRIPPHMNTTFTCTPDFLIFSDMAQKFRGLEIHDSLDELYKYVDMSNPDLKYYEYLNRKAGSPSKAKGKSKQHVQHADGLAAQFDGAEKDRAWEMDKYKNIPILRKSYAMYPEKKWFVFVDADTAVIWPNILAWTQMMDHTKPWYTGSQVWIGDVEFAHGGSGYIVSQAAAQILASESEERAKEHIGYAATQCCGDMVLAHAFHENNIALNGSWPHIQGARPDTLDYHEDKWCHAAMTFHHVADKEIDALWRLGKKFGGVKNITYGDIWSSYSSQIIPQTRPSILQDWDNYADQTQYPSDRSEEDRSKNEYLWEPENDLQKEAVNSPEGCAALCHSEPTCFQWTFHPGRTGNNQPEGRFKGRCGLRFGNVVIGERGGYDNGSPNEERMKYREAGAPTSGWELERIEIWSRKHRCEEVVFKTKWDLGGRLEGN